MPPKPRRPPGAKTAAWRPALGGPGASTLCWWGAAGCAAAVAAAAALSFGGLLGGGGRVGFTAEQRRCLWDVGDINVSSGMAIEEIPLPSGGSMRGMVLKKSVLSAADALVAVPMHCMLTQDSAMGTEMESLVVAGADLRAAVSEEIERHGVHKLAVPFSIACGHQTFLLTLILLRELTLGPKSLHPDWLAHLPKKKEDLDQPLMWSDGELKWLEGTLLGLWVKQYKPFISSLHERMVPYLIQIGYIGSLKLDDFYFALMLVESRHFEITATMFGPSEPVMVPVLDSVNHCDGVKADLKILNTFGVPRGYRRPAGSKDQRTLVMTTAKTFSQGEEICYMYSATLNVASSLFTYGFSSPDMPDVVDLLLSDLPDVEPIFASELTGPQPGLFVAEMGRPLPGVLMCTLRLREMPDSQRADAIDRTNAYGYEWCTKEQLEDAEAEARVWQNIGVLFEKAIERQERSISMEECSGQCSAARFQVAKRYRKSTLSFARGRKKDADVRAAHMQRAA